MITISMNGKKYQAQEGENVLKVAIREGIEIPYLCYQETLSPFG
ncbi:MAG: (2Fe-2S)-binding protein, partial [Deltaproteobacteria bacterium]|nr:(2Fe-2S)-binding protein [Deltaproteobacteria bacterium]